MSEGAAFLLFFCLPLVILFSCYFFWLSPCSDELSSPSLGAPAVLPHFPYAAGPSPAECAICLDELRQGHLCSEVPACRHIFHESCIRAWTKKTKSCPLCRAKIVPGGAKIVPGEAPAAAADMV